MLRYLFERALTRAMKLLPDVEITFNNFTENDRKGEFPFHAQIALRDRNYQKIAHVEWNLMSRSFRVGASVDPSEGEVKTFVALPPVAVYFGLHSYRLARFFVPEGCAPRETSLSAHDGSVWWKVWADPTSWSSQTPRWRDGSWSVVDFLLGPETHRSETVGEPEEIVVHLPEGAYRGRSTIERSTWTRPRWFAKTKLRADVTFDPRFGYAPIPTPGKGENFYDCDEDALYSMGCMARSHEEAVGEVVKSVLSRRRRYGGTNWRPDGGPHGSGTKGGGNGKTASPPDPVENFAKRRGLQRQEGETDEHLLKRCAIVDEWTTRIPGTIIDRIAAGSTTGRPN